MAAPAIRIAYLNSRYPSLSHTFIEREIRALRARGVEVHPCSVRPPGDHDLLGPINQEAARETYTLLDGKLRLMRHAAAGAARHPVAFLRILIAAQQLSPPGLRARAKHFVYALEAVRLARELGRRGVRHVHVHMANNGAAVGVLASRFDRGLAYSLTIHGSEEFFNIESIRLRQKTEPARFVRCVSEFTRSQVMAWTAPEHWERYHVVRCGLDLAQFPSQPLDSTAELRLLVVARLDPIKGLSILFEACRLLSEAGIAWSMEVVGDGPMRSEFEFAAARSGIAGRVTFTGAIAADHIQEHYQRAHVLVVPSFMEGLPVVIMEALAMGRAVVASRVAAIPELVVDGDSGLLVTPGSIPDLFRALRACADRRQELARYGRSGRTRLEREFAIEVVGNQMVELFRRYAAP